MKYLASGITIIIAVVIGALTADYIREMKVNNALEKARHEADRKETERRAKKQREIALAYIENSKKTANNKKTQNLSKPQNIQNIDKLDIEQQKATDQKKAKTRYELEKEFEAQFIPKFDCEIHFVKCVDERRNAKEKYLADHGYVIDQEKKLKTLIKKNSDYTKAAINAKNELIGVNQILRNMEDRNSIRKQKNDTCMYWLKNQDGTERAKNFKKIACGIK